MNIQGIYRRLEDVQNKLLLLQTLSLNTPEIHIHADRLGWIHSTFNYTKNSPRTFIAYENLWGDASHAMFDTVIKQIEDMERVLTARLLDASGRIQADLAGSCGPGTISFWRADSDWQQSYLHHSMWECRNKMLFVDGYRNKNGMIEVFICKSNLVEMPFEYQVSFIRNFWGQLFTNSEETIAEVDAPPPVTDDEKLSMLTDQKDTGGHVDGSYLLH